MKKWEINIHFVSGGSTLYTVDAETAKKISDAFLEEKGVCFKDRNGATVMLQTSKVERMVGREVLL